VSSFTDAEVDAVAASLAGAPSVLALYNNWHDQEIEYYRKMARIALEAAARSRATTEVTE